MTRIAEGKMTRGKVDNAHKKCHKHAMLVVLTEHGIHASTHLGRRHLLSSHGAEQAHHLSHEQRRGDTLSRDIAQAEIKLVALYQIVIKVATNLTGWHHISIKVKTVAFWECARHH